MREFSKLLQNGFIDTFRHLHKDKVKYSWWSIRFGQKVRINNIGWPRCVSGYRNPEVQHNKNINTSIEFKDIRKEKLDIFKDKEVLNFAFSFSIIYPGTKDSEKNKERHGEIILEGSMLFSVTEEESKEVMKFWKKRQIPPSVNVRLSNFLLKKCAVKALVLEEELGLPTYPKLPMINEVKNN